MVTDAQWVEALQAYRGVPFRHMGRDRFGLDCIGLLLNAARDCGVADLQIFGYGSRPQASFFSKCNELLTPTIDCKLSVGCILVFWIDTRHKPRHLGVVTELPKNSYPKFIHSHGHGGIGVVETTLTNYWNTRILSSWEIPNIMRAK